MSNRESVGRLAPIIIAGICLLAGVALFAVRRERLAIEGEQARTDETVRASRRQVTELAERLAVVEREQAEEKAAIAAPGNGKHGAIAKPARASRSVDALEILRNDPKLQLLQLEVRRRAFRMNHQPLIESLGLDEEQIAELERIMERKEAQTMDLRNSALSEGLAVNDPKLAPLWDEIHQEADVSRRALLGEDGWSEFQEFERTSIARELIGAAAGAAALSGVAFTREQADALAVILAESSDGFRKGGVAAPDTMDWAAVDARAAIVLSEQQLRIFQSGEAMGVRGMGSRHLPRLNHLIHQAQEQEAKEASPDELLAEAKLGQR